MALIEAQVIAHLMSALQTNYVYAERPKDPPGEYYLIELTGADEINHIRRATMAVQSISGASLVRAAEMNEACLKAMPLIVQTTEDISCCRMNSAYNFTNPETREYRYQAVFDLYYMEGD